VIICNHCGRGIELSKSRKTLSELLESVATSYGMAVEEMVDRIQTPDFVGARRTFARLARAEGFAFTEIGRVLRRSHGTVISMLYRRSVK
jgi:chromosomal replication initiation ATPase DnaA